MNPAFTEFQGKHALITGGTQGIGKAIARRLAGHGAIVHLSYAHNEDAAARTCSEFNDAGYEVETYKADLGDPEAVATMLAGIDRRGPLDILVCNAAYQEKKGFFETDLALMHRTLGVNIFGNFQLLQAVASKMSAGKRPGRALICSSGHGSYVFKGTFAYDVSKAALNHFMRCAALELIERDIRLNAIDIGWTHTPGERRWFSEEQQNELSKTIPIGRAADADEIAAVAEFLLSDQASYVVGSLYAVDGGFALKPNPET
jgi:glucose 1-dehydrogenase